MATLQRLIDKGFEVRFLSHAEAILTTDFPIALAELEEVVAALTIPIEEIIGSGGGETKGTQRLRRGLAAKDWSKVNFQIDKRINGVPRESISHEVDHVRNIPSRDGTPSTVALEIEWNNKDPFFDRDLENFKRLHAEGAISVGVIVTRGSTLQAEMRNLVRRWADTLAIDSLDDLKRYEVSPTSKQAATIKRRVEKKKDPLTFREAWVAKFVGDKYGAATTHWSKLDDRVHRGVGSPCPLLLIGLPANIVTFGEDPAVVAKLLEESAIEGDEDEA